MFIRGFKFIYEALLFFSFRVVEKVVRLRTSNACQIVSRYFFRQIETIRSNSYFRTEK
jgi:hypothetical protein